MKSEINIAGEFLVPHVISNQKKKIILKFYFPSELLPFVKEKVVQARKYHYYRLGKSISNALVYSHGLSKGHMWYHVKDCHLFFRHMDIVGS